MCLELVCVATFYDCHSFMLCNCYERNLCEFLWVATLLYNSHVYIYIFINTGVHYIFEKVRPKELDDQQIQFSFITIFFPPNCRFFFSSSERASTRTGTEVYDTATPTDGS